MGSNFGLPIWSIQKHEALNMEIVCSLLPAVTEANNSCDLLSVWRTGPALSKLEDFFTFPQTTKSLQRKETLSETWVSLDPALPLTGGMVLGQ